MSSHHAWHHADENERKTWQDPQEVLDAAGLKAGITFADIGCGRGFFALPAARIIGPEGKVYGLDIDKSGLQELQARARSDGLNNIEIVNGPAEETLICEKCADIVFFGIVLHDFQDPFKVLQNAYKMLKPGGLLVDLDWKKRRMSMGPPLSIRFNEEKASALIASAAFQIESVRDSGRYCYLIFARPDGSRSGLRKGIV